MHIKDINQKVNTEAPIDTTLPPNNQIATEKAVAPQADQAKMGNRAALRRAKYENPEPPYLKYLKKPAAPAPVEAAKPAIKEFNRISDAAEYSGSHYLNAVRVERGISLEQAMKIAQEDPEIEYFVYTKGYSMVLSMPEGANVKEMIEADKLGLITHQNFIFDNGNKGNGAIRAFRHGDVVFFRNSDQKWLGSAPGLADTYVLKKD